MNEKEYCKQFTEIYNQYNGFYHSYAAAQGFSDTVFWILYLLCKEERSYSQNELAEELCIAKQTVNSAVAKLVKDGYVELISRKGLRQGKYIALTEAGKARCCESVLPLLNAEKKSMERLGGDEALHLLKLFQMRLQYLTEEV